MSELLAIENAAARPRKPGWLKAKAPGSPGYMEIKRLVQDLDLHTQNFIEAVKTRGETNCPPRTAWRAAVNCHMGNVAYKVGRKVYWNQETGEFIDDGEANALLSCPYRSP